jgi:bifunctional DNA-binding transcriptional regulator/antitoxin component of YhaV-PrlF toxin-antitoxin module
MNVRICLIELVNKIILEEGGHKILIVKDKGTSDSVIVKKYGTEMVLKEYSDDSLDDQRITEDSIRADIRKMLKRLEEQ